MRRTLLQGLRFGACTGLGIATGDATYACVAALGLASISHFMLAHDLPLHLAAGLFLLYLGARTFYARSDDPRPDPCAARSLTSCYGGSVLLTLTNPPTIISFAAIFAALAPRTGFDGATAAATVAGVFAGSTLWWLLLVTGVGALRHVLDSRARRWLDRMSATVLVVFGVTELKRAT